MENEIKFWETGALRLVPKVKNQYKYCSDRKPQLYFAVHGILGEQRHDVEIRNKWLYMSDEEKSVWIVDAKRKITEKLTTNNEKT